MLASFTKKNPPPHRVKPVPIAVLRNVCATTFASQCPIQQATADKIVLAFFFLLRPGEYTATIGPSLGYLPFDVSARCLRAAGATALLCADVDSCHIQLLGRWSSDEMLRYLHLQAQPLMKDFSRKMLHGGAFTLIPNQLVPSY
jgi:hypothetical protein